MALLGMFKQRRPRQYTMKYRYYDEHKERLAESAKRVRAMQEQATEEDKILSADDVHAAYRGSLDKTRAEKKEKTAIGLIIGMALLVIYLILHYAG